MLWLLLQKSCQPTLLVRDTITQEAAKNSLGTSNISLGGWERGRGADLGEISHFHIKFPKEWGARWLLDWLAGFFSQSPGGYVTRVSGTGQRVSYRWLPDKQFLPLQRSRSHCAEIPTGLLDKLDNVMLRFIMLRLCSSCYWTSWSEAENNSVLHRMCFSYCQYQIKYFESKASKTANSFTMLSEFSLCKVNIHFTLFHLTQ